jgi:hypothetical protein
MWHAASVWRVTDRSMMPHVPVVSGSDEVSSAAAARLLVQVA